MTSNFVSPTGYIDLDNDCEYSIDRKSTRSREDVDPKTDLSFYWNTYLVPKYGLNNINVNNVASFMKELEMNWTKLTPDLQNKVMDIMVDSIFSTNNSFRTALLEKLNITTPRENKSPEQSPKVIQANIKQDLGKEQNDVSTFKNNSVNNSGNTFGNILKSIFGKKSAFGSTNNNTLIQIIVGIIILGLVFFIIDKSNKASIPTYPKFK